MDPLIFDEMFTKINAVLGGRYDPEDFAKEVAFRVIDLECQVSSLSDIMAAQENEIKALRNTLEERKTCFCNEGGGIR